MVGEHSRNRKEATANSPLLNDIEPYRWKEIPWVEGARFTLNPTWGKGLRRLVEGGT
jgi:hypothetical protein